MFLLPLLPLPLLMLVVPLLLLLPPLPPPLLLPHRLLPPPPLLLHRLPLLLQIDVVLVQQGSTGAAYGLVLLCVVLTAVGDGITQPTVYADAALLPDKYTQASIWHDVL